MFTQEIADSICERLTNGESLRSICLQEGVPNVATVIRWLADERYVDFRAQYTRAREAQADAIFDEILDIADEATDDVQRSRLRVDARKWMAGKLKPKVYGEKIEHEHGGNPDKPFVHQVIERVIVDPKDRNGSGIQTAPPTSSR